MLGTHSSRVGVGLLLLLAMTGCGSTVPLSQRAGAAADGLSSGGVSGPTDGATGSATTGAMAAGGTTGGSAGGTTGTTGVVVAGTTGATTSSGSTGATRTPDATGTTTGVVGSVADSKRPITVAVFHLNGGNQVISSAFPGSSVSFGDGKKEAQAVIDDINAHGGAGGRKILPQYIPVEATDSGSPGLQKACQGAVQDYKPVAIFAMFNLADGLVNCAKKSNTLLIDVALGAGDEALYRQAKDIVFSPSQISRDAEQRLVLGLAHQQGKLPAGKPVGLLVQEDDPSYDRVSKNTIEPLLKSYGVPFQKQTLATGADTQGVNNAILKFVTNKVDTVIFSLGNGGIPEVLFMQSAEQQAYRPAYLMGDSTDTSFVGGSAPAAQIKRISGAGTYPLANVRADQYPSTGAEKKCIDLLNKQIGGYTSRSSSLTGTLYCEIAQSFAFVAGKVQGKITAATWAAAYHQRGTGYPAVTTFGTHFLPGRPDGASAYRGLGYSAACSCISYTTRTQPIPTV